MLSYVLLKILNQIKMRNFGKNNNIFYRKIKYQKKKAHIYKIAMKHANCFVIFIIFLEEGETVNNRSGKKGKKNHKALLCAYVYDPLTLGVFHILPPFCIFKRFFSRAFLDGCLDILVRRCFSVFFQFYKKKRNRCLK